jgi:solute carrier family 25 (mitochondrial carnitine/acylcarnitine transporter), member 20/29
MSSLAEEALGGFSAGILGTVIGYPLDAIKTRMQTSTGGRTSVWQVGNGLVRTQGVRALYRGVGPPLISLSLLNTLNFGSYAHLQSVIGANRGTWDWRNGAAGACCGPLGSTISTVENLIKTQMQLHSYQSSYKCVQYLVSHHGLSVLYTGHVINTAREVTFLFTYFILYEGLRTVLGRITPVGDDGKTTRMSWWAIPAAGGLAGATAWAVSFPLDCVRAAIQGRDLLTGTNKTSGGIRHVARQLVATKGLGGLYAGVTPTILRAFVVSGTRFSAYETTLWLVRGGRDMGGSLP